MDHSVAEEAETPSPITPSPGSQGSVIHHCTPNVTTPTTPPVPKPRTFMHAILPGVPERQEVQDPPSPAPRRQPYEKWELNRKKMQEEIERLKSDINQRDRELQSAREETERVRSRQESEVERVRSDLERSHTENTELKKKNSELETKNRELVRRTSQLSSQSSTDTEAGEQLQKANLHIEGLQEELHSLRNPRGTIPKRIEVRLNESIGRVKQLEHQLSCTEGLREVSVRM